MTPGPAVVVLDGGDTMTLQHARVLCALAGSVEPVLSEQRPGRYWRAATFRVRSADGRTVSAVESLHHEGDWWVPTSLIATGLDDLIRSLAGAAVCPVCDDLYDPALLPHSAAADLYGRCPSCL